MVRFPPCFVDTFVTPKVSLDDFVFLFITKLLELIEKQADSEILSRYAYTNSIAS